GCGASAPRTIEPSYGLADLTQRATARLEAATGVRLQPVADAGDVRVRWGDPADCGEHANALACTRRSVGANGQRVGSQRIYLIHPVDWVLLHELGHAVRGDSPHNPEPGLMSRPIWGDRLTAADVAWICSG